MIPIPSPRLAGLAAVAGFVIALAAPASAWPRAPRFTFVLAQATLDASGSSVAGSAGLQPAERDFILDAIQSSRDELEIARLALSQARRSDIRTFAQQLVTDFNQINNALEALARRKAVEPPLQPTGFSDSYRQLARESGPTFDRAFVHETALVDGRILRLCEGVLAAGRDSETRDLAGNLLPTIRDHVNQTTDLQKSL